MVVKMLPNEETLSLEKRIIFLLFWGIGLSHRETNTLPLGPKKTLFTSRKHVKKRIYQILI